MFFRNRLKLWRPQLGTCTLVLLVATYIVSVDNRLFWQLLAEKLGLGSPGHWAFFGVLAIAYVLLLNTLLLLLTPRLLAKPVLGAMVLLTAGVSYFADNYGVVVDPSMINNIVETNTAEALELFTAPYVVHMLAFGVLPAVLIAWVRLQPHTLRRAAACRLGAIAASLVLVAGLGAFSYKEVVLFGRSNRDLQVHMNPYFPLYSLRKVVRDHFFSDDQRPLESIARDATRPADHRGARSVVVLAVGETARAQEFSLNGYPRDTNAWLANKPIIDFSNVQACGTATAESVPCMFSLLGKDAFNRDQAARQENLLDVLQRTGVKVVWRDNDAGSKGVADRVAYEDLSQSDDAALCAAGNCYDEILLQGLEQEISAGTGDMLIVLHLKGSHGPSYYKRTPPEQKIYLPECSLDNIQDCSRETIVNAYDNTIRYTDYLLAKLIDTLAARNEASALLYVSDHGESLGENGLYLHGLPYAIAPEEQTRVPMLFWASDAFVQQKHLDMPGLQQVRNAPLSHDVVFHSLLDLFDVNTGVYRSGLDLFSGFRNGH